MALKEKVSVSLDRDVARQVREEAGEGHMSEWLNHAALLRLQATSIDRLISEHGIVVSDDVLAEVEAEWPSDD